MDLHPVLINFIGLSRQPLTNYSVAARSALKYVYRFLALLCKGYIEAQMEMIDAIPIIKGHIT